MTISRSIRQGLIFAPNSTIPACAIRLYYLNPSTIADNRNLAISLANVCTQIQLGYGVMAASITVLKPFMVVYEKPIGYTGYQNHPAKQYATNNSEHTSFKMNSVMRSSEVLPTGLSSHVPAPDDLSHPTYSSRSPAPTRREKMSSGGGHERDDSIHSQDSRRLIIERQTAWSIRYEEADSHKSNASEAAGSV